MDLNRVLSYATHCKNASFSRTISNMTQRSSDMYYRMEIAFQNWKKDFPNDHVYWIFQL
jgi:hypothetical protein